MGRYYLEKKIGEGGFGAVYKAWNWQDGGKRVAVKQINITRDGPCHSEPLHVI